MCRLWKVRTGINNQGVASKGFRRFYIEDSVEMSVNKRKLERE
jgi:hypothetical protein